jgi:hypothetical protein
MVSALVFTVAPFQLRHNARCTALESLERSSMRFKLSTLIRSESQSAKGSGRVRVRGETLVSRQLRVGRVVPALGSVLIRRFPLKHAYVQVLKTSNGGFVLLVGNFS